MEVVVESSFLDYEMSIKTVRLEREYERALADSARILDLEKDRVRRMEHLLLQFENEDLCSQLDQANTQLSGLTRNDSDTLAQLKNAYQDIDRLDRHVQSSSSENERLKAQISAMDNTSTNYNSLLSEKMQLDRDLSNLKSELDRVKTQSSLQQASTSGKQDMERHINSLEVQLGDERHAHERTRAKNLQQAAEINTMATRIEELQSELSRQSRAKQQHDRELRQHEMDWEKQRAVLENKIETLRKQLRLAKDKLQAAQNDLQQRRNIPKDQDADILESRPRVVSAQPGEPSVDHQGGVTIATPGAVRVQEKIKRQSALPGDKSAFSITPFLNRTSAPRDSPDSSDISDVDSKEARRAMADSHSPPKSQNTHNSSDGESSPLNHQAAQRSFSKGTKLSAQPRKHTSGATTNQSKKTINRVDKKVPLKESLEPQDPPHPQQGQAKPRKRKLGAQRDRNPFEDEEEEIFESRKQGRKVGLGAGRPSVLGTGQVLGASSSDRPPKALRFGGFSPLKRDRKR
ncbi:hypothetical protein N7456_008283 [Penicillium angulare]|uniref:Uncharacterized protein n=1 Tax=Penicillium angulare TaxID=116970 RepID=A0A9W9KA38_9EURO|nr:hypothetical protein N7456_008283 [Penicillium angulare]